MIEAFDYKGYRVVITEYLKTFPSSGEGKLNQHISIVGIDNRLTLFLDNTALDDAKAKIDLAQVDAQRLFSQHGLNGLARVPGLHDRTFLQFFNISVPVHGVPDALSA